MKRINRKYFIALNHYNIHTNDHIADNLFSIL